MRPFPRPVATWFEQVLANGLTLVSGDPKSTIFDVPGPSIVPVSVWPCIVDPSCECGAPLHSEETHEEALLSDIARTRPGCTCPGYAGSDGEPYHDGLCNLAPREGEPC